MKGYETYRMYLAAMHHFNPKFEYDYFKYNGKAVCKVSTFSKNKAKWLFAKLEKLYQPNELATLFFFTFRKREYIKSPTLRLFQTNLLEGIEKYQDMFESIDQQIQSLQNYMEVNNLTLEDMKSEKDSYPILYNCVNSNIIDFELFELLVNLVYGDINKFESTDPILWPTIVEKINLEKDFLINFIYPEHKVEIEKVISGLATSSERK